MKTFKRVSLLLLIVSLQSLIADIKSQNLDSLESILTTNKLDNLSKLKIYDDLSWEYLSIDFAKAKRFANTGIDIAHKSGDVLMEAKLYRNLGVAYYMVSIMDSAKLNLNNALTFAQKVNDENLIAAIYGAIGNVYNRTGTYEEAIKYYLKSLECSEKTGNKQRICKLYGNIGEMYRALNNFDRAEEFFTKTKDLSTELGDDFSMGQALDGLGYIYMMKKDIGKAISFGEEAAKIFQKIDDKNNEAISYQGIAMAYYSLSQNYAKAEEYALKALKLNEEMGFPGFISGSLNILSNVYWSQSRYLECSKCALKAIQTDSTDKNVLSNLAANVVRSNLMIGNKNLALKYFDKYRSIIDIRANQEFQQSFSEMEVKYETEKKELEIHNLQKERSLIIALASFGGLIFILLLLVFIIRHISLKRKKLLAEQQIIQLQQEKQLVATHALLEGETTERARLSKDLHDGLGGLLSVTKHKIANMKGSLTIPDDQVEVFNSALEMLDSSITELRRVAHNLMPESLMRYGLNSAISDFCNSIDKVSYHFYGAEKRIDEKLEVAAFRIVNELVNNALKHANASKIDVQLVQEQERISITVYDDGRGFDPKSIDRSKPGGLNNIESRVLSFNGRIDLFSAVGKGTEVSVEFKL